MIAHNWFLSEKYDQVLFGLPEDIDPYSEKVASDMNVASKGSLVIRMVDMAIDLLGPDLEPLEDNLFQLGRRHIGRIETDYQFQLVGEAFLDVLEGVLKDKFTPSVKQSFAKIYHFLAFHMMRGLKWEKACRGTL